MRANAVRRSSDTVSTRSVAVVPCGARVSSKKKVDASGTWRVDLGEDFVRVLTESYEHTRAQPSQPLHGAMVKSGNPVVDNNAALVGGSVQPSPHRHCSSDADFA